MTGDLVVELFDSQDGAAVALSALRAMRRGAILGLDLTALVSRENTGHTTVQSRWGTPIRRSSHLPRILAEALAADDSEQRLQALTGAGLDGDFIERVKAAFSPDCSALVIYIPQDAVADVSLLLSSLRLFQGEVYHTTCPARVEQAIIGRSMSVNDV